MPKPNPSAFNVHSTTKSHFHDLLGAKQSCSARFLTAPRPTGFRALAAPSSAHPTQNVMGVGIGEKFTDDKPTGVMAVRFFVRRKYTKGELARTELLPSTVEGLATDVEETGIFRAFAKKKTVAPLSQMPNPKARFRPAQPGCSIGFQFPPPSNLLMGGTFGALVKDAGGTYFLSNNHVLADEGRLAAGADIFQPGLLDGGNANSDKVAKLTRFIPLQPRVFNHVDCAIARANSSSVVSREILHIGAPSGAAAAAIDMRVHKFGRTTSYTVGHITSVATDVTVGYETGNFRFEDQVIVVGEGGAFSTSGDSGSLILERQSNQAVALLFAGSNRHTIANHIGQVLQALQVTLA